MNKARERWKASLNNVSSLRRTLSRTDSIASMASKGSVAEEVTNKEELEEYFSTLKNKTGLRGLWSGNKFDHLLDDKTPDISISSSDDNAHLDMDFNKIHLDSDEDEMRIDYMREAADHNNNITDDEDLSEGLNLMQNIHFAELKVGDVQLSDDGDITKNKQTNDYLPNLYTVDFDKNADSNSDSDSKGYFAANNIRFLDRIDSEIENDSKKGDESKIHSIIETDVINTESVSASEIDSKINDSVQYSQKEFKSRVNSSESKHSKKHGKSQTHKKNSISEHSSVSLTSSSQMSNSVSNSRTTTSRSTADSHQRSRKSRKSRNKNVQDTLSSSSSSSAKSSSATSKSKSTRTSSTSTEQSKSLSKNCRRSRSSLSKQRSTHSKHSTKMKTNSTQTDDTHNVLNFKYPWQQDRPHNIAASVVDAETLHVLTSYEPAVLAAHDMMKYHFQLLQQHITNSRRLYESYVDDHKQSTFKYTTIEDTMKFIKENRPTVVNFDEALAKIQETDRA